MKAFEILQSLNVGVEGIIHVGANVGQERPTYVASGAPFCMYIEPITSVFEVLKSNISDIPGHIAVQAVCSDVSGQEITMNIASNAGLSSSILPLGEHQRIFPHVHYEGTEVLVSKTLDEIVEQEGHGRPFNLLVIDAQGADLKVLRGAHNLLSHLDGIYVEISEMPLYEGGCTVEQITSFLSGYDFRMKWMEIIGRSRTGDAFYARSGSRPLPPQKLSNLALGKPAIQSSFSMWSRQMDAQGGNNGHRTGSYGFHTDREINPWWQLDLEEEQKITEVRIYNRVDTCGERALSLRVMLSRTASDWRVVHDQAGRWFGGIDGRPLRVFPPDGTVARFVRLQLNATESLHLDEIEVY
jgi:FkbM family methyltransferase